MTDPKPNSTQNSTLMTTIQETLGQALSKHTITVCTIVSETRTKTVEALAEKFGFSVDEAVSHLDSLEPKSEKKRGPIAKAKKEKTKSKEGKVKSKRSPTGYLMFSKSARSGVQAEMSDELAEGTKLAPQAVVKELAKRWKALNEEERLSWNSKALEAVSAAAPVVERLDSVDGSDDDGDLPPLEVKRTASVSWNDYRLPAEAPRCNHVGQCSCGW